MAGSDAVVVVAERVCRPLARRLGVVARVVPAPLPPVPVVVTWHHRHDSDPAHAWLRAEVAEILREVLTGGRVRRAPERDVRCHGPMEEPLVEDWRAVPIGGFAGLVRRQVGDPAGRPPVLAIDGRSSGGKTTLAARPAAAMPGTAIVHTDDVAWWHAAFDWVDLLVDGVLAPVHRGAPVSYRPPKWDERGRPGAIEVPAGASLLVVEGVGAGRRELTGLLDGVVWVQTDPDEAARRDAVRVAAGETTPSNYAAWMAEEGPFVDAQRAWERAFVTVCGSPALPHDPQSDVVVGPVRHAPTRPDLPRGSSGGRTRREGHAP